MSSAQTRVLRLERSLNRKEFRTAVSLHSHTHHSHENLEALPQQVEKIPVFGKLVQARLRRYTETCGRVIDFGKIYWTPPVSPAGVFASETRQIEQLGLPALVSITDHDSIAAGLSLQSHEPRVPVSLEWTVPFRGDHLHLGVHHLPAGQAVPLAAGLAAYTACPDENRLADLLALLNEFPDCLLVLNHPCWDVSRIGAGAHATAVQAFLTRHGDRIHALELNGLRSWSENRGALSMGNDFDIPVVAGGDRHGCRPNTVLNLSHASTWEEFVTEIRGWRRTHVLVLPSYHEPLALRQMEVVADALSYHPDSPYGRRSFRGRTFVDLDGFGCHPLSFYWECGEPLWLRLALSVFIALGSGGLRPVLRHTFFRGTRDLIAASGNEYAALGEAIQKPGSQL